MAQGTTSGIEYFRCVPDRRILPGESVKLTWRTHGLTQLSLSEWGHELPVTDETECYETDVLTVDTTFVLTGRGDDGKDVRQELTVLVLRPGWYEVVRSLRPEDPGFSAPASADETPWPLSPLAVVSSDDGCLYVISRATRGEESRDVLFRTVDPFGAWQYLAEVPEGFATSPAIWHAGQLWLIGGSKADPAICSNDVWSFTPGKDGQDGQWEKSTMPTPTPRMGHCVVRFEENVWVMGGIDSGGAGCTDVWLLDQEGKWTKGQPAPWLPRCMLTAAAFDGELWVYGGAAQPFSATLYDDLFVFRRVNGAGRWDRQDAAVLRQAVDPGRPIASRLEVFRGELHLWGSYTRSASDRSRLIESRAFRLSQPEDNIWTDAGESVLAGWGATSSFCCEIVNFGDRMLAGTVVGWRSSNQVLKVYVPGCTQPVPTGRRT